MSVFISINPPSATLTQAFGINASGQIVGTYIGNNHIQRSFLYSNGIFTTVSNPAAENIYAFGINDVGHLEIHDFADNQPVAARLAQLDHLDAGPIRPLGHLLCGCLGNTDDDP